MCETDVLNESTQKPGFKSSSVYVLTRMLALKALKWVEWLVFSQRSQVVQRDWCCSLSDNGRGMSSSVTCKGSTLEMKPAMTSNGPLGEAEGRTCLCLIHS